MLKKGFIILSSLFILGCQGMKQFTNEVVDEFQAELERQSRSANTTQRRDNNTNPDQVTTGGRGGNGGNGGRSGGGGDRRESRRNERPSVPWWENYGTEGAEAWQENRGTRDDESVRDDGKGEWDSRGSGDASSESDYVIVANDTDDIYTASYSWNYKDSSLRNKSYQVSIELDRQNINDAQDHLNYINQLAYYWDENLLRELDLDWSAGMEEIYIAICEDIYDDDSARFDDIVVGFEEIFDAEGMNELQQLYFVVTFIQNITYRQPGGGTDLLPPTVTLAEKYGDCDTVSMLAYLILDNLGFDVVMMASEMYGHAMLGVNTTATGDYLEYAGKRYYFLELTYPDWWLGELDSSCDNTRYWYAFKLT